MMKVWVFPPRLSWRSLVSLLSLKGRGSLLWFERIWIIFPSVVRLRLMFLSSCRCPLSMSSFLLIFSLPARSQRLIFAFWLILGKNERMKNHKNLKFAVRICFCTFNEDLENRMGSTAFGVHQSRSREPILLPSSHQGQAVLRAAHWIFSKPLHEYPLNLVLMDAQSLAVLWILKQIKYFLVVDLQERAKNVVILLEALISQLREDFVNYARNQTSEMKVWFNVMEESFLLLGLAITHEIIPISTEHSVCFPFWRQFYNLNRSLITWSSLTVSENTEVEPQKGSL